MDTVFWVLIGLLFATAIGLWIMVSTVLKNTHSAKTLRLIAVVQLILAVVAIVGKILKG